MTSMSRFEKNSSYSFGACVNFLKFEILGMGTVHFCMSCQIDGFQALELGFQAPPRK